MLGQRVISIAGTASGTAAVRILLNKQQSKDPPILKKSTDFETKFKVNKKYMIFKV